MDATKPEREEYQHMESTGSFSFPGECEQSPTSWTTETMMSDFDEFLQAAVDIANILETCPLR